MNVGYLTMTDPTPRNRSPLTYFVLTFALSIPFWIAGTLTDFQILPGIPIWINHAHSLKWASFFQRRIGFA
jgi:hypothetical protein